MRCFMKDILNYKSISKDSYKSDACIVWCIDARFDDVYESFVNQENLQNVDLIKFPGGSKALAEGLSHEKFQIMAEQIKISIMLHKPDKVILSTHASCGAYAAQYNFSSYDEEYDQQFKDLNIAKENLVKYLNEHEIETPAIQLAIAGFESLKVQD